MTNQKLYVKDLTKRMQLRGRNENEDYGIFICGIDVFAPAELSYAIVTSNMGIWGTSFKDFVEKFIRFHENNSDSKWDLYTICDDPMYDVYDDEIPSPKIDEKHLELLLREFETDENGEKYCELF